MKLFHIFNPEDFLLKCTFNLINYIGIHDWTTFDKLLKIKYKLIVSYSFLKMYGKLIFNSPVLGTYEIMNNWIRNGICSITKVMFQIPILLPICHNYSNHFTLYTNIWVIIRRIIRCNSLDSGLSLVSTAKLLYNINWITNLK